MTSAAFEINVKIGGSWVEITGDVLSIRASWGLAGNRPDDLVAGAGACEITLKSPAGLYAPGSAGAFAGFTVGLPVQVLALSGAHETSRFYGTIERLNIRTSGSTTLVDMTVVDWMDYAARYPLIAPTIQSSKRADEAVQTIIAAMPIAPIDASYLGAGVTTFPTVFDAVTPTTRALSEFAKLANSENGYIYLNHNGGAAAGEKVVFEPGNYRNGLRVPTQYLSYDGTTTVALTVESTTSAESGLYGAAVTFGDFLINYIKVTAHPRLVGTTDVVLYSLPQPITLAGGETKTLRGTYSDPAANGNRVNGSDMIAPTTPTDYLMNTLADGTGTDISADLTIAATYGSESVLYTLTNTGSVQGFITKLQARGKLITAYDPIETIAESAASYNVHGYQTMTIDQQYQQDLVQAELIADKTVNYYKNPRMELQGIQLRANRSDAMMAAFLQLDVGDMITVRQSETGIDGNYYIQAVTYAADGRSDVIDFAFLLKQAFTLFSGLAMVSAEFAGLTPGGAATDVLRFGNLPQIANIAEITVSAWVYPHTSSGEPYQYTVGGNYNGGLGWLLAVDQDDKYVMFIQQGTAATTPGRWRTDFATVTLDAWNHIAVTRDTTAAGNQPVMYVNGVSLTVTEVNAQDGATDSDAGLTFQIGNIGYSTLQAPFNGYIRDFRVYASIISAAGIDALYDAGTTINSIADTDYLKFAGPFSYTDELDTFVPPAYGYRQMTADDRLLDGMYGDVGAAGSVVFTRAASGIIDHNIVLFGDSITEANGSAPTDKGYFNWLNVMLSQRWDVVTNAGVGGNSTTQMLARISADVIAYAPAWVMIMGGVNDIAAGTGSATILSNLDTILQTVLAAGMYPIISTLPPSTSFDTTAEGTVWAAVNVGIRAFATTYPGVLVVDAGPEYWDSSQPTLAVPLSGYTVDGVHPNALGAGTLAAKMYTDLYTKPGVVYPPYQGLALADIATNRLYYSAPNQMMAGTGGAEVAPATGDTATGFVTSAGGTWSKVARTDGKPGAWQQCVIGAEADQATFGEYDITAGFSVGDVIYAQVEFESDNDWVSPEAAYLYLAALKGSTVLSTSQALGHSTGGGSGTVAVRVSAGIYRTERMTIPATTDKIRVYFTAKMVSGTFRISRFEIVKVV